MNSFLDFYLDMGTHACFSMKTDLQNKVMMYKKMIQIQTHTWKALIISIFNRLGVHCVWTFEYLVYMIIKLGVFQCINRRLIISHQFRRLYQFLNFHWEASHKLFLNYFFFNSKKSSNGIFSLGVAIFPSWYISSVTGDCELYKISILLSSV